MSRSGSRLRDAVTVELARIWKHPADTLAVVAVNGVTMTIVWFVLPRDWFFRFTGPSGYAVALASWMYADVTATNILATDRERVLTLLDKPEEIRNLLRAKEIALWLFIAPLCSIVAIGCGLYEHDWRYTVLVVLAVAVVPIGALAITGVVGVLFPYHQQPLIWRWRQRRRFRPVIVRWGVLAVMPYLVYPAAAVGILAIPLGIAWLVTEVDPTHRVSTAVFALCLLLSTVISILCWWWSNKFALTWIERHRVALSEFLADRERG